MSYHIKRTLIYVVLGLLLSLNGNYANQATNWDITFLLNRNFGVTSINSDLEFPIEITKPKSDLLYSVPAHTLFADGRFPVEPLYLQLNFQPKNLSDEYYFIAIRDPDMVLRFGLSIAKRDMFRVSLKYHPVESVEGEKEIEFPIPNAHNTWRLGILIKNTQIKFYTSCPQTQPVAFHIEDNVNLLGVPLFKPGASAFLLNSGLKMSPAYFSGILTEFGFHAGKMPEQVACQASELIEGSGEPMYTFDPEFGNILVTQVDQDSYTTTPSAMYDTTSDSAILERVSPSTLTTAISTSNYSARDPKDFAPYIDLSNFVVRVFDLKENRLLTDSKVGNGSVYFPNGTSISLLGVPGFEMNSDNAEVLLSIDLFTDKITSLVDIASGETIAVKNFSEGISLEIMQKYRDKVMFELLLDSGALQIDTYNGRWVIQDTSTGQVNEIKAVRDGVFILDNKRTMMIPKVLQNNEHILAIEAFTGKVGKFDSVNGETVKSKSDKSASYTIYTSAVSTSELPDISTKTKDTYEDETKYSVLTASTEVDQTKTFTTSSETTGKNATMSDFSTAYSQISAGENTSAATTVEVNLYDQVGTSLVSKFQNGTFTEYDEYATTAQHAIDTDSETAFTTVDGMITSDDIHTSSQDHSGYDSTPRYYGVEHYTKDESLTDDTNFEVSFNATPSIAREGELLTNEEVTASTPAFLDATQPYKLSTPDSDGILDNTTNTLSISDNEFETSFDSTSIYEDGITHSPEMLVPGSPSSDTYDQVNINTTYSEEKLNIIHISDPNLVFQNSTTEANVEYHSTISSDDEMGYETFAPSLSTVGKDILESKTTSSDYKLISGISSSSPSTEAGDEVPIEKATASVVGQSSTGETESEYIYKSEDYTFSTGTRNETLKRKEDEASMNAELASAVTTTIDPTFMSSNQSLRDILKPDCYCLEEFLNSDKIEQLRGPPGPKGEPGITGRPGRDGICPSSCEALLTPELLAKLKGPKGDPGSPGICNVTVASGQKGDTEERATIDAEDPKIMELLRKTVTEYFNSPEVLAKFQVENAKNGECGCSNDQKFDSSGRDSISADIMDSLRKISYGAIVMDNESSLAKVAFSMPLGVMVYLRDEDIFYLKTQENENIWRIIRMGPTSEGKRIPKPELKKTTLSPQLPYPNFAGKKLYLVAQSETFNGELKYRAKLEGGHSGALFICQREASSTNLTQPFYPLLNTDMFNADYVVPPMHRFNLPIINLHGEKLFDDFNSLIRGKQKPQAPIYTFNGKDINEDLLSSCIWLGEKPIYQGGDYEQVARSKCRNWQTSYPSERASAARVPILANASGLLHQSNIFEESCSKRCHVLCIQILPS